MPFIESQKILDYQKGVRIRKRMRTSVDLGMFRGVELNYKTEICGVLQVLLDHGFVKSF